MDDRDCPDLQGCYMSNHICMEIPGVMYESLDTPITISAGAPADYVSTISVAETHTVGDVHVKLEIQHFYRGDLTVTLSHLGTSAEVISADVADSDAHFYHTYDGFYEAVVSFEDFDEQAMTGNWTLTVSDGSFLNGGQLLSWELYLVESIEDCTNAGQCDDEQFCTIDSCPVELGYCVHSVNDCDDADACTTDSCDIDEQECVHVGTDCDDGNPCTVDACNPANGLCANAKVDNCTASCTTHNDCGWNDYCDSNDTTCKPIPGTAYLSLDAFPANIPDSDPTDLVSTIVVDSPGDAPQYISDVHVKVLITHPYKGDLTMSLSNGTEVLYLHTQTGGAADNV